MSVNEVHAQIESPACAICGFSDTKPFPWGDYHLNLDHPLHVVQCRHCGMLFMSPRPDSEARLSLLNGKAPEILQPYSSGTADYGSVTRSRAELFRTRLHQLQQILPTSSREDPVRMLDIGASSGVFVNLAHQYGWDAHGVEPSSDEIRSALASGTTLIRSFAETLPYSDDVFNIVHSHHVFEHLADPRKAIGEAYRVLKPGGVVFIEVPNQLDNVMFRRDILLRRVPQRKRSIRSVHHLWFFSRTTLRKLLELAGFEDIHITDHYSWKPNGWRAPFTLLTQFAGKFTFGGYLIRGWGRKS